ncbi:hypothetical protein LNV09_13885 [Paucibacter sp. B2R-40]|uniref:hypothetical protein n=1 Tax=Paucibacter sp. B2R-40 TaxID=2893554 RepID=UPI0021E4A17D|nr:hypothetical protein [Paucibacter sp. B2R-40]MCV2355241.1 hypothetical protein [Paucibacter sp. B2R-40]
MRLQAVVFAISLAWAAPLLAAPLTSEEQASAQTINLKIGESAQARDEPALRIGFAGVAADSRCPKGAQCIWAGEATVRVWLQRGNEPKLTLELTSSSGSVKTLQVLDQELSLLDLSPYPVAGKAPAEEDYTATLSLSRSSAAK